MKNIHLFEAKRNPAIDEFFFQLNVNNIGQVLYWFNFFEMIKNVEGDIVECGVGGGRSLLILSALNLLLDQSEGGERTIYGYDSFSGFPEPTVKDKSWRNPKKGEWSTSPSGKYAYTKEFIKKVISLAGVPSNDEKLFLTRGYFEESLLTHPPRPIALLHLDGDLYQSYKSALEAMFSKVSVGGIIVFDDFLVDSEDNDPFPGARLAVKEFLGKEYDSLLASIAHKYYYVKK